MESRQRRRRKSKKVVNEETEKTPAEDVMKTCGFCGIWFKPPSSAIKSGDEICAICFRRQITEPTWVSPPLGPELEIKQDYVLEIKCKYKNCNYYTRKDKIQDHQNTCEYFRAICLEPSCRQLDKPWDMFDHCRSAHKNLLKLDKPDHKIISYREVDEISIFNLHVEEVFGEIFFAEILIDLPDKFLRYTATNMTLFDPEKFELVIEFEGEERNYITSLNFFHTNNAGKEKGYDYIDTDTNPDLISENFKIHVGKK